MSRTRKRTVIANATVGTDYGVFPAHVVIEDGRVAELMTDSRAPSGADEIIDASGLVCLPGAIDPHAHFEDPGRPDREDFLSGTMAAAAGGITSVFEHPLTYPPTTTVALYREKREMAKKKAVIDFGLWGALTLPSLPEIQGQWLEGAIGFKAFMPASEPDYPHVTDDVFLQGMRIVRSFDGLVLVHAENDALLRAGLQRMHHDGRRDPLAHHESRPPLVEEEAVHRALFLAAHVGVRIQIVHVSSPVSAELVRQAKKRGERVSMEVCPHHLLLDLGDLARLGALARCAPALRERALVEGLWQSVIDGTADSLASDHCPYTLEEKEAGIEDIFRAPNGCQVIQETVPLVLDECLHSRDMSLDGFVRFSATNTARILGLYPRKGTIVPGSDADLTLWDADSEWVVYPAEQQFSKNPYSVFEGRRCRTRLVRTIVRGETVYANGEIMVEAGHGSFLSSQS